MEAEVPKPVTAEDTKIDEQHEESKTVKELIDEGNADLALGKFPTACEYFSMAVEKL